MLSRREVAPGRLNYVRVLDASQAVAPRIREIVDVGEVLISPSGILQSFLHQEAV